MSRQHRLELRVRLLGLPFRTVRRGDGELPREALLEAALARLGIVRPADPLQDGDLPATAERLHHRLARQPAAGLVVRADVTGQRQARGVRGGPIHAVVQVDDPDAPVLRLLERRNDPFRVGRRHEERLDAFRGLVLHQRELPLLIGLLRGRLHLQ